MKEMTVRKLMNSSWICLTRLSSFSSKSIEWFLYKKSRKCVADISSWSVAQVLLPPTVFLVFRSPHHNFTLSFPLFALLARFWTVFALNKFHCWPSSSAERESFTFSGKILPLSREKGWSVFLTASFRFKGVFSLRSSKENIFPPHKPSPSKFCHFTFASLTLNKQRSWRK